ncbi:hypothetical protein EDB89DRAFT_1911091 [Lactarius sanguifluus]|nr:hypothetical protein EDB89DRAFT_1911091 [Lactarius sanguifluus]
MTQGVGTRGLSSSVDRCRPFVMKGRTMEVMSRRERERESGQRPRDPYSVQRGGGSRDLTCLAHRDGAVKGGGGGMGLHTTYLHLDSSEHVQPTIVDRWWERNVSHLEICVGSVAEPLERLDTDPSDIADF